MKKTDKKKESKYIFSGEVDRAVGGAAVGMAFVVVAIFVTLNKTYLINETVTIVVRWLFLLFGTPIALACLLHKAKCNSNRLASGVFISGLWLLQYLYLDFLWTRVLGLLLLFLAAFLIFQELFSLIYSLIEKLKRSSDNNVKAEKYEVTNSLFALIATILGLILVAMQMLQQIGVI